MTDPREILTRPAPAPDLTLRYGDHPDQIIDVRLPPTETEPRPLVVFIHGGFWRSTVDRSYGGSLAADLASRGHPVASIEFRRAGQPGGGWPGTFDDVSAALAALPALLTGAQTPASPVDGPETPASPVDGPETPARPVDGPETPARPVDGAQIPPGPVDGAQIPPGPVDGAETPARPVDGAETAQFRGTSTFAIPASSTFPEKAIVMGHSSGGHLALWAAATGRHGPLVISGVLALAPVCDLMDAYRLGIGENAVANLLGDPARQPDRTRTIDPIALPAPAMPTVLVHGDADQRVPISQSRDYVARHPSVRLLELPDVDHFAPVDPRSPAWPAVLSALATL